MVKVFTKLFDILISNLIILITYLSILIFCSIIFLNEKYLIYAYFPFGILVLGFLFFGNKVIFGFTIGHVIYYILSKKFNLNLYFNSYFILSICYITCVPVTLLILNKLKINVGIGHSYKLDKSNIYHVILITLFSSVIFLFLTLFFAFLHPLNFNNYFYFFGNFIGGSLLILILKLIVHFAGYFKI